MPRTQVGYEPGAAALQTLASPNLQGVKAQFDPNSSSAYQLAAALGKAQPTIDNVQQRLEREKFIESQLQQFKKESYASQFSSDQKDGGITAVQVGQRFPETVPAIRAQVAEGIGQERGKGLAQPIIQDILQNETLRLDTDARAAHLKGKRDEFIAGLKGDAFYNSGAIGAYDKEVQQYENTWQRETAQYHTAALESKLSREVVETLKTGGDLLKLDETWKNNNGLGNAARNKVVVDTMVDQAFASDDPTILDKIDVRFRNADTDAKIQKMKILIQEKRMSSVRDADYLANRNRDEDLRKSKTQMINDVAAGKQVDPAKFKDNPEAFAFAVSMKDAGRLPDTTSIANAEKVRATVLNMATVAGVDPNKLSDQILANKNINPAEKSKLIADIPKLIEGVIAMNDDRVKSARDTRLERRLVALENNPNSTIAALAGGSLRSDVMKSFDYGIRANYKAYFEKNGKWPTGFDAQEIVDREVDKADKMITTMSDIKNLGKKPAEAAKVDKPVPTQADIDFAKKNPQFKQKFIDKFGREP